MVTIIYIVIYFSWCQGKCSLNYDLILYVHDCRKIIYYFLFMILILQKKIIYILNYCKLTNLQGEGIMVLINPSIMHKINILKIDTKEIRKGND